MVEVDFIVGDAYSPYTAIVAKPWLPRSHLFYSTPEGEISVGGQIKENIGSQSTARQYLVAVILHQPETEYSAFAEKGL